MDESNKHILYEYVVSVIYEKTDKILMLTIIIVTIISFFKKNVVLPVIIMSRFCFLSLLVVYSRLLSEYCNLYLFLSTILIEIIGLIIISILYNRILLVLLGAESILQVINLVYNLIHYTRIGHITDVGIIHMMIEYGLGTLLAILGLYICKSIKSINNDKIKAEVINN